MFPQCFYGLQLYFIVCVKIIKQKRMRLTASDLLGVCEGQPPRLQVEPCSGDIQSPCWSWIAETSIVTTINYMSVILLHCPILLT